MEVVEARRTLNHDVPVVIDVNAVDVDAVILTNRVKPYTDFDGEVEGGSLKMLIIGMDKQRDARIVHKQAVGWSFRRMIPEITGQLLDSLPIVGGVATVEDQHDDTTLIKDVPLSGFFDRECELLETAYELTPKFPFEEPNLVVFNRQGKEISGQGMDTNVINRRSFSVNEPAFERPNIRYIYTYRLIEKAHGNAMGVGSAGVIHGDVAAELDAQATLINVPTVSTIRDVKFPPVVETDRAGVIAVLLITDVVEPNTVRAIRAADITHLHRLYASSAPAEEARERDDLYVVEGPTPVALEDGQFAAPSLRD